jgi:Fur family transcriptional regulator, ferric uptake regulator
MSLTPTANSLSFRATAIRAWQQNGSRRTFVREVLCDAIAQLESPFTAETLLPIARRRDRGISMASVYRTLGDLTSFGLLHETRGAQNEMCFSTVDPAKFNEVPNSATVVCRDCGHLHQVADPCLAMREGPLAQQAGFKLRKLDLRMEADCTTLHQTGSCHRRPKPTAD